MKDLVAFVTARLDEREALARFATEGPWLRWHDQEGIPGWDGFIVLGDAAPEGAECNPVARIYATTDAAHIAANDPAHVLREVAAMRAIVDEYETGRSHAAVVAFHRSLRHLAAIWDTHADYVPGWRP